MILWCDGNHDPAENMRRDRALLAAADRAPDFAAVLRVSGFDPPGITLGYAQRAERDLDLARCARDGVPWARRPTGGRAVFHAEEWTYALAARLDDPRWGGSLAAAYASISELVVCALVRLGVPARFAAAAARGSAVQAPTPAVQEWTDQPLSGLARHAPGVAPCFVSTARHEIVLHGRKLVGSAQRRTARALLQQGSILLGPGHVRLVEYLAIDDARRAAERARLDAAAAHAGDYVGARAPRSLFTDALAAELGTGVRRLTLLERDSYTRTASHRCEDQVLARDPRCD